MPVPCFALRHRAVTQQSQSRLTRISELETMLKAGLSRDEGEGRQTVSAGLDELNLLSIRTAPGHRW
jgi:hypothetical protein